MDLHAALRFLDDHVNLEATAGRVEGLSLERMRALSHVIGDPQDAFGVVHVTGTNGKGSVGRMTSALLRATDLSVGTYSSPHLSSVTERLVWDGAPISDDDFGALIGDLAALEPMLAERPSYFELVTAAAFRWFADIPVDVAVVEVGLLGRYDATNVCDGQVAVLTNVGRDHTDGVGDWRRRIAEEKVGIVKPGSTFVLGETDPDLADVFGATPAAEVLVRGRDFDVVDDRVAVGGRLLTLRTPAHTVDEIFLPLHGAHQAHNAASRWRPPRRSCTTRSTPITSGRRSPGSACQGASRWCGATRRSSSTLRTTSTERPPRPRRSRTTSPSAGRW